MAIRLEDMDGGLFAGFGDYTDEITDKNITQKLVDDRLKDMKTKICFDTSGYFINNFANDYSDTILPYFDKMVNNPQNSEIVKTKFPKHRELAEQYVSRAMTIVDSAKSILPAMTNYFAREFLYVYRMVGDESHLISKDLVKLGFCVSYRFLAASKYFGCLVGFVWGFEGDTASAISTQNELDKNLYPELTSFIDYDRMINHRRYPVTDYFEIVDVFKDIRNWEIMGSKIKTGLDEDSPLFNFKSSKDIEKLKKEDLTGSLSQEFYYFAKRDMDRFFDKAIPLILPKSKKHKIGIVHKSAEALFYYHRRYKKYEYPNIPNNEFVFLTIDGKPSGIAYCMIDVGRHRKEVWVSILPPDIICKMEKCYIDAFSVTPEFQKLCKKHNIKVIDVNDFADIANGSNCTMDNVIDFYNEGVKKGFFYTYDEKEKDIMNWYVQGEKLKPSLSGLPAEYKTGTTFRDKNRKYTIISADDTKDCTVYDVRDSKGNVYELPQTELQKILEPNRKVLQNTELNLIRR